MQFWTNIIQNALLGTDKKQLTAEELSADIAAMMPAIQANTALDREEQFLQAAALAFNYRQSGALPLHQPDIAMEAAPAEELPYCSAVAYHTLTDILSQESPGLLQMWLRLCASKQQIAPPAILPALLDKASQQKQLRQLVEACAGKRGKWLSQFNEAWHFAADQPDEALWHTGTPEQRKQILLHLSVNDPGKARTLLQQTWAQENAAGRADLLKGLPAALFEADSAWLEGLLNEKSVKVKEEALRLLKQLPDAALVQQYWQIAQQAVTVKKEKALLGLSSKISLQVQLPANIDENIFKTGIEKKGEDMILSQLISCIPPHYWEAHLQETPANIFELFAKDKNASQFLPAFAEATGRFKNSSWAPLFTRDEKHFYEALLALLPQQEREKYLANKLSSFSDEVIRYLTKKQSDEWGLESTAALLKFTSYNPYTYNRSFYNQHIHLVPVAIIAELEKYGPKDEYVHSVWKGLSDYIRQLLALKTQTIKAFQ